MSSSNGPQSGQPGRSAAQAAKLNYYKLGDTSKILNADLPEANDVETLYREMGSCVLSKCEELEILKEDCMELRVATMYSGTDAPMFGLEALQDALKEEGKSFFKLTQVWACENNPQKQAFLFRNRDKPTIFADAVDLSDPDATEA